MSLRVIRELVKARPPGITQFTEQLTSQSLESYMESDCNVSQAAEDMFSPLAAAFPPPRVLDILIPIVSKGVDANSLGAMKLLSKVYSHITKSLPYCSVCVCMHTVYVPWCVHSIGCESFR